MVKIMSEFGKMYFKNSKKKMKNFFFVGLPPQLPLSRNFNRFETQKFSLFDDILDMVGIVWEFCKILLKSLHFLLFSKFLGVFFRLFENPKKKEFNEKRPYFRQPPHVISFGHTLTVLKFTILMFYDYSRYVCTVNILLRNLQNNMKKKMGKNQKK